MHRAHTALQSNFACAHFNNARHRCISGPLICLSCCKNFAAPKFCPTSHFQFSAILTPSNASPHTQAYTKRQLLLFRVPSFRTATSTLCVLLLEGPHTHYRVKLQNSLLSTFSCQGKSPTQPIPSAQPLPPATRPHCLIVIYFLFKPCLLPSTHTRSPLPRKLPPLVLWMFPLPRSVCALLGLVTGVPQRPRLSDEM